MRAILTSVAFCCLFYHAHSFTKLHTFTSHEDEMKEFHVYSVESSETAQDISTSNPCPNDGNLAVFESADEYAGLLKDLMDSGSDVDGMYWFGIIAHANNVSMRTNAGGRMAPFVNFHYAAADASLTYTDTRCAVMEVEKASKEAKFANFKQSPWKVDGCSVSHTSTAPMEYFICQNTTDAECQKDCMKSSMDDRPADAKMCKWKLYEKERKLFTWQDARKACMKYGGQLFNLIDMADVEYIKNKTEGEQAWNMYWLGGKQGPDDSYPKWYMPKGENATGYIDEMGAWADKVMYGSQCSYTYYATMWNVGMKGMNLYNTVYHNDGKAMAREAFAFCEATQEDYCMAHMPHMMYANMEMMGGDTMNYTCKEGYEFSDGAKMKELTCNCHTDFDAMKKMPKCIMSNPCMKDSYKCGIHGYCIFTSDPKKPYYCLCKKGYEYDEVRKACVDIDECKDHNPCGEYYGKCINLDGDFMCQCEQGMNWDNGKCVANGKPMMAYVDSIMVHFYVDMPYEDDMNAAQTERHKMMEKGLEMIVKDAFENDYGLHLANFHAKGHNGMTKVQLLLGLQLRSDITTVSMYAYKFTTYVKHHVYFEMGHNSVPIDGVVAISTKDVKTEIKIHNPCSIFESLGTCHEGKCMSDEKTHKPMCKCPRGSYGPYCEPMMGLMLKDMEIGLISALGGLFLFICLMPLFMWCCYRRCCRGYRPLGQPSFGQPSFAQPSFGQPTFGQPTLGQPNFGHAVYDNTPVYSAPGFLSAVPKEQFVWKTNALQL